MRLPHLSMTIILVLLVGVLAYDIAVKRDLNGVRAALKQSMPNSDIQIEGVGDGVVLLGGTKE